MTMDDAREEINIQGPVCPRPLTHDEQVVLGHGSGGRMTQDLITNFFYPPFENPTLLRGDDAAVVTPPERGRLALSTDSHIVSPLFFPGGDIGRLAVCGTVNDLAMVGAHPLWLTAGFILEEGLPLEVLERVAGSMKVAAEEAGVIIVAGDTKVAEREKVDRLFINTTGIGWVPEGREVSGVNARPGDVVLLSGPIGDHGIVRIGHSEYARRQGYLLPPEATRIAPAVMTLVVAKNDLPCLPKEGSVPHHLLAHLRMPLDLLPLAVRERAGLVYNRLRQLQLGHIVKHRRLLQMAQRLIIEAKLTPCGQGQTR